MGFAGFDSTKVVTTTTSTNTINDARRTVSDNGVISGGNVNISNGAKEGFNSLDNLAKAVVEIAKVHGANTVSLNDAFSRQAGLTSDIFGRSMQAIAGLSETKISDGSNITASVTKIGLGVAGLVAVVWLFKKK